MYPDKYIIERLRQDYPVGSRIELVRMDDPQAPPIGTKGTVSGVDDIGSIMVNWDNGSRLNVVYGKDAVKKAHDSVAQITPDSEAQFEKYLAGMYYSFVD